MIYRFYTNVKTNAVIHEQYYYTCENQRIQT